ncbi:hypothetical protein EZV62_022917 [Acer yangbiense]|uniref:KIB1-4 beta-propeller domain-containing protein n=1 Tax=Acer yangbiense TaxID=1000413 RepID=A0A5C7H0E8_9ROSI|nr:hypothetical protein EZV62_022917 [Acer yangbiense]
MANVDVLEEIARLIKLPEDFVAFSGVCSSWRSAASKENFRFRYSLVPWLMLPPKELGSEVSLASQKFYALDVLGGITALDIKSDNTVEAKQVANLPNGLLLDEFMMKLYLDESAGKLLVVARNGVQYGDEVRSIGEEPIGEGDNSSLSVEVLDISSLKPNCIYFTDDCQTSYAVVKFFPEGGGRDMGIYNLQDGSIKHIEPYFKGRSKCNLYDPITPPMWIEESL